MNNAQQPYGGPPMAPPPDMGIPYASRPPARSVWPTVIGVIAIVFGAAGFLQQIWGVIAPFFVGLLAQAVPAPQRAMFDAMNRWRVLTVSLAAVSGILAALLLIAGIGFVRRRRWAIRPCCIWALLKIVTVAGGTVLGYFVQRDTFATLRAADPSMARLPVGFESVFGAVGLAVGVLWGWALPIFVLIWFARRRVRDEVAGWDGGPALAVPVPPEQMR